MITAAPPKPEIALGKLSLATLPATGAGYPIHWPMPLGMPCPPGVVPDPERYRRWLWQRLKRPGSRALAELQWIARTIQAGRDIVLVQDQGDDHGPVVIKAVIWLISQAA